MGGVIMCSFWIIIDIKSIYVEQRKGLVNGGREQREKKMRKWQRRGKKGDKEYFQTHWKIKYREIFRV